jgi:Tol biopolymer transport system component
MGEVYRARDTRLGREVAVKVLSDELAGDSAFLARFEREARLLASVNHPNIATIHEIDEEDGVRFLALELIEGETLVRRLTRGTLPQEEALQICRQVAEALEAAHEKGIIHRDLKPGNIMLTRGNHVKVLDFGLAKEITSDDSEDTAEDSTVLTKVGDGPTFVGTVPYMSPEQIRGEPLDQRTDIWAFGCIMFEALSGRRAFAGDTGPDTVSAILTLEPRWDRDTRSVTVPIRSLVQRCLEKDANRRFRDVGQARLEIESALRGGSGIRLPRSGRVTGLRITGARRRGWIWAAVVLFAAAGLFVGIERQGWLSQVGDNVTWVPRLENPVQVTSATGVEEYPSWSADGRTIAYQSNQDGNWDIWVVQPGSRQALNRTADHPGNDLYPSWSPDGLEIAFWSDRDDGGYFVMPALAGAPRKVVSVDSVEWAADVRYLPFSPPRWSADGKYMMYVAGELTGSHAEVVDLESGESVALELPGKVPGFDPSWSPDEQLVAYVAGWMREFETSQIRVMRLSDGESGALTTDDLHHLSPTWARNGVLSYVVNRGYSADLWQQAIDEDLDAEGPPHRLTTGVGMRQAVFSPDGSKLAYSKGRRIANLWRVPVLEDRPATWDDAEQLTFDQAWVEFVDASPDGELLAVSSDRAGNKDLWVLPATGGELQQLTNDERPEWAPQWSPDGTEIAFYAYRDDQRAIWIMPSDGGPAQRLEVVGLGDSFIPAWSPDGSELAFRAMNEDLNNDIYRVDREGGKAIRLTSDPAVDSFATWSPDGRWITFVSLGRDGGRILGLPAGGGPPELLTGAGVGFHAWAPEGDSLYALGVEDLAGNIWEISLTEGQTRPVTDLSGRDGAPGSEALTTDGAYLYFTWEEDLGDIWVMDVVREDQR